MSELSFFTQSESPQTEPSDLKTIINGFFIPFIVPHLLPGIWRTLSNKAFLAYLTLALFSICFLYIFLYTFLTCFPDLLSNVFF